MTTNPTERDELAGIIAGRVNGPREGTALTRTFADAILAAGYRRPRTITTVAELDTLGRNSIVAVLSHSANVPLIVVFQRGSNSEGGGGWCTPEAMGQITSEQVFEFIGLNCLPYEFTVLHDPSTGGAS